MLCCAVLCFEENFSQVLRTTQASSTSLWGIGTLEGEPGQVWFLREPSWKALLVAGTILCWQQAQTCPKETQAGFQPQPGSTAELTAPFNQPPATKTQQTLCAPFLSLHNPHPKLQTFWVWLLRSDLGNCSASMLFRSEKSGWVLREGLDGLGGCKRGGPQYSSSLFLPTCPATWPW